MDNWQQLESALPPTPPPIDQGVVLLTSGQLLKIHGVTLYPIEAVSEVARLREMGVAKMGGISTGIGFLGSPGWALGAGAALGILEGALSSSARKEGARLLVDAENKHLDLRRNGRAFRFGRIQNRDQPNPNLWRVDELIRRKVDCGAMMRADRNQFLARYGKTKADLVDGMLEVNQTQTFVYDGGEFFIADTETGLMNIRWQNVVAYTIAAN